MIKRTASVSLFFFLLCGGFCRAETIYLTPEEALKTAFKGVEEVVLEKKSLSEEQLDVLSRALGLRIERKDWNFYLGKRSGRIAGYAVIDHEIGRMDPITFMTVISPEGNIQSVEILIYRESQGSEVHEKRFLNQFEGKNVAAPLKVGQDIQNISGATLSVRAIAAGVKRDLSVWNAVYGGHS